MALRDRWRYSRNHALLGKGETVTPVIDLPLETGGSVLFEVEDLGTERKTTRGAPAGVKQVATTFESVIAKLKPVVE